MGQADIDLKLAVAELRTAKEDYQSSIYKDRHQRKNGQEQEREEARLKEVEGKMDRLEVRSPYAGTIKKIKWLG